jgi:hypothetical protein
VLLPSKVTRLISELITEPAPESAISDERTFLFQGRVPGRHRSVGTLVARLNRYGIHARLARNTALIGLAADMPAAVLADLLGISPQTAVRWARLGNIDWAAYLAAARKPIPRQVGTDQATT